MDPQIFLVFQEKKHGIRNRADTQLKGCSVLDQSSTVSPDGLLYLGDTRRCNRVKRIVGFHDTVELRQMNQVISSDVRHLLVDLADH